MQNIKVTDPLRVNQRSIQLPMTAAAGSSPRNYKSYLDFGVGSRVFGYASQAPHNFDKSPFNTLNQL